MEAMQKAGEVCGSCRDRWKDRRKSSRTLVALPVATEKNDIKVVVCSWCDGPTLKLAQANHASN